LRVGSRPASRPPQHPLALWPSGPLLLSQCFRERGRGEEGHFLLHDLALPPSLTLSAVPIRLVGGRPSPLTTKGHPCPHPPACHSAIRVGPARSSSTP